MRYLLAFTMICAVAGGQAPAGAWLQDHGNGFLSFGSSYGYSDSGVISESGIYAEYGVRPGLTVGLDFNQNPGSSGHVLAFIRLPVAPSERPYKLAAELGIGASNGPRGLTSMYKAGLSWGRGFESRWGNGWMSADAAFERRLSLRHPVFKLDATLGFSTGGKFRPLFRIETSTTRGKLSWAVAPSLMIDRRERTTWVIGLKRKSDHSRSLTFDIWRRF